jgi:branched-chain amino acid transport system substrate-binding protein
VVSEQTCRWLATRSLDLRRVGALVLTIGVLASAAACERGGGTGGGGGETLKIGGVGPLSQPGSVQAGQDMKWAMEAAVEDINADGKVLGKTVKLVFQDTEGKPEAGAAVAKKLVEEEKVAGVVGEYHSSAALAQVPVYNQHGTPFVVVDAYSDKITAGDPADPKLPVNPPSVFRIAPTNSYDIELHANWLVDGIKARNVVQIYEATDFGVGQAEAMKKLLGPEGVKLTQIKVELNQPDYKSILSRVKAEQPDVSAVMVSVTGETSYTVTSNAFDVGLLGGRAACVANQVAQDDKAFWRVVPDGAGCVFRVAGLTPNQYTDAVGKLAKRYTDKFGNTPKAWVFEAYDAARLLVDAIGKAGSEDPAKVVGALEQTSYQGLQGKYEFRYRSGSPVPADKPAWLWHQWPEPAIQLAEYTKKGQTFKDAVVVWPPSKQSTPGTAYVQPNR